MTNQTGPEKTKEEKNQNARKEETPKDNLVTTQHSLIINERPLPYTVTCGTIVLKEESEKKGEKEGEADGEKPKASIFFVAYTRDDIAERSERPITFAFNGGPGSSSVWLHLGLAGPRRVLMDETGNPLPPPYKLVDNAYSLLDITDLVFIDPVSTGFSRPAEGEKARDFHGFRKDIESMGDFIRLYTSRYQRWSSPKFLMGESYGTTRAAGLSGYLQERHNMYLNGLILISTALNFSTLEFDPLNDLPYILILPTYAATAWYHKRLPEDLQQQSLAQVVKEAEQFAGGEYTLALMQGAAISQEQRSAVLQKLARLTGLSQDFIDRCHLRVEIMRFAKELLRDERRSVGRLDTRFKGIDRDAAGEMFEHDPSMSNIMGPYTATFNDYVRSELKFESDLAYEILTERVWPWSYAQHENRYVDVADTLRFAMQINPFMKVFVASGYYDMATPHFAGDYVFNHLGLDPALQSNIQISYFEAGHMMYIHLPSIEKLKTELTQFIHQAAKQT
jgi:carboxypeptidase C (cathepsin A)